MIFSRYKSIIEPILNICHYKPDYIAIKGPTAECSYSQLDQFSDRIAYRLNQSGICNGDFVGICLRRDITFIGVILAIYKIGAAYVPLDPDYPIDRLKFYVKDSGLKTIVTEVSYESFFKDLDIGVVCENTFISRVIDTVSAEKVRIDPGRGAYLMYTSGSTGKPKGVIVEQSNLLYSTGVRIAYYTEPLTRYLMLSSFSFDSSVAGIFWTLCSGGTLVLPEQGLEIELSKLANCIAKQSVSHVLMLPSLYQLLLSNNTDKLKSLKVVILAGEALNVQIATEHFRQMPEVNLYNEYGPTECTVWSAVHPVSSSHKGKRVPIGKAIPGAYIVLLDEHQNPVSIGKPGEIYIGGPGVTKGYLGRKRLNIERFIDWKGENGINRLYRTGDIGVETQNGILEFLGRIDQQVKISGYRIELGEVETVLMGQPGISEAAVVVKSGVHGDRLVAYYTVTTGQKVSHTELRTSMISTLPGFMVPTIFVALNRLPHLPNGKIDRNQLPEPGSARPDIDVPYIPPVNELQKWLTELWAKYLQLDKVGIKDRFLELGGTSLIAARIINDVQNLLNESVFVVALFNAPTIERFAEILERDYQEAIAKHFEYSERPKDRNTALLKLSSSDFIAFESLVPRYTISRTMPADNKNRPAVFILSPPRSGTTLLQFMLAGARHLYTANELQLLMFNSLEEMFLVYTNQYRLWTEGLIRCVMDLNQWGPDEARRRIVQLADEKVSTIEYFSHLQSQVGDRLLVDKSPSYSLDLSVLEKMENEFSGAMYIHLTRHPFAMVESFIRMHMEQVVYLLPNSYNSMQLAELIWTISHRNVLQFLQSVPEDRFFRMKFEDLVSSPEDTMRSLCNHFSWEYNQELSDPYRNVENKITDGIYPDSKPMGDPLFLKHGRIKAHLADRWRGVLDNDILSDETWNLAEKLGYLRPNVQLSESQRLNERRRTRRGLKKRSSLVTREKSKQ